MFLRFTLCIKHNYLTLNNFQMFLTVSALEISAFPKITNSVIVDVSIFFVRKPAVNVSDF